MRGYSHFSPSGEYLSKNQFANYLPTLRLAGWHYTQGIKTLRVKAEGLASIRLCRERCPVTSKDVEGRARHCKAVEGAGSHFSQFAGPWFSWLERLPVTQEVAGSSPVAPAIYLSARRFVYSSLTVHAVRRAKFPRTCSSDQFGTDES